MELTLLDVDLSSKTYEIIGELKLNPTSIENFSKYDPGVHMDLLDFEKFSKLEEEKRIFDGSYPTKITFSSGFTIIVAEYFEYIQHQMNYAYNPDRCHLQALFV